MSRTLVTSLLRLSLAAAVFLTAVSLQAQNVGVQSIFVRTTISSPGSYVLANDLTVNASAATAITITANGVTLDLNGHEIKGPGGKVGTGIMIDGARGVKVVNGNLSYLAFGVVVNNSSNVVLRDLQIRGQGLPIQALPPETGVMIVQSKNVCVEKNIIYNTGLGVFVRGGGSWGNRVVGNTLTANTNGAIGICYNPGPGDPAGPRGDLVQDNLITGFNTGIQASATSMYNIFRANTISFITQAMDLMNETNQDILNVAVPFP